MPSLPSSLCNFPLFAFAIKIPNPLGLIPIPNITVKLPFPFPPVCPLDTLPARPASG